MFDFIVDLLSDKWWTYALVLALIVFDSVFPVLPSETALIATGIIAAQDGLSVVGLVAVAWAGAVIGDNVAYTIGDRPGRRLRRWLLRRALDQIKWMRHQMGERPWIVTIARFIPAGRTAAALSAGALDMPRRRFVAYVVTGGLLWAMFNVLLGYTGGTVFQQSFWLPLLVSFLVAGVLSAGAETARRRGLLGPSPDELDDGDFDDSDLEEEAEQAREE
ncbi:MAG TPA: DedA family protein [Solirubrobacteraceae bacterium]|nr:DedA family protein [Solirubrobacteraceae bacterium]